MGGKDIRCESDIGKNSTCSRGMILFSVSFYIMTSIVMVLVNKAVLNTVGLPITFLTLQILVAVVLLQLTHILGWFKMPYLSWKTSVDLGPLIAVNVCGLTLNTLCLHHVDASFYQVARSLVLPFTVLLSRWILGQSSSLGVVISCVIVCSGFLIGSHVSLSSFPPSNLGLLFGILSSVTTALHAIVIKKALDVVKGNTIDLVYYNNVLSVFGCLPVLFWTGELNEFYKLVQSAFYHDYMKEGRNVVGWEDETTWDTLQSFALGVLGFFGFLINIAGFLQIKVTSPVTHMMSSAFRGVLQTFLAVAIFHDSITVYRAIGIALILMGSAMYSTIRSWETEKESTKCSA